MGDADEVFLPHVREYLIPRDEYLSILVKTNPDMHEFYNSCDWYSSSSIQIDSATNTVTIAGLVRPKVEVELKASNTLLHFGPANEKGLFEFFAKFAGPVRLKDGDEKRDWVGDFKPISCNWDENGVLMRFAIFKANFKDWSYFQILEPYARHSHTLMPRNFPRVTFPPMVHETLYLAYSLGYFERPRKVSLREIAKRLDISHTMVSRHLREAEMRSVAFLLSFDGSTN